MSQRDPFREKFRTPPREPRPPAPPGVPVPRHLVEELQRASTARWPYRPGEDAAVLIYREGYQAALSELLQQADDAARPQAGDIA